MEARNWDVVVVGGGLAGLAAGARAARAGRRVLVLEKSRATGGRATTRRRSGFALNQGPHALYRKGEGIAVLRALGIEPRGGIAGAVGSFADDGGRLQTLPGGLVSLLTTGLLTLPGKIELARLLARVPSLDPMTIETIPVAAWVDEVARDAVVRRLLLALARLTTYTADANALSAGTALRQLQTALAGGVLYLDDGWQSLVDDLDRALRDAGGLAETGARVATIEPASDEFRVVRADGRAESARAVVVALPAAAATEILPRQAGEDLRRRAAQVRPVRAACLDLALSSVPRPRARFALGIDRPLYASLHSAVARLAPPGGGLIHAARYLVDGEDGAGAAAEIEALVDRLQPGWRSVLVERRFLPEMVVASDLPRATEGGSPGRPSTAVRELPGLYLAGDWVGPTGLLADASLASGDDAAARAIDRGALPASRTAA